MSELMYRDIVVVTLKDKQGVPAGIEKVDAPELLPFSLSKRSSLTYADIKKWLSDHSIPQNREGISYLKTTYPNAFKQIHYASLTNSYWIRMRKFDKWKDVNFFTRHYDEGLGNLTFRSYLAKPYSIKPDSSPDLMTNGVLRKCWRQNKDNSSYLIKAGSVFFKHEPLSEVLASVILEKLKILPYVRYDLHVEGSTMCSRSDNFIKEGEELVTAEEVMSYDCEKTGNTYNDLLTGIDRFKIPGGKDFIDKLIFIDELIGNTARGLNDIGFIYLPDKQKFKGPAPVFDNGAAFFNGVHVIRLGDKSLLFGDVAEDIYKKMAGQCPGLEKLKDDKKYREIISNFPDITAKTAQELIEAVDMRMDVSEHDKNVKRDNLHKGKKTFGNMADINKMIKDMNDKGKY